MATSRETECKFVLITSDGAQFEVSLAVIRHLRTLDTMLGGKKLKLLVLMWCHA